MTQPWVWAPVAARVDIEVDGERHPMERSANGRWTAGLALPAGTEYAFVVDGAEPPIPDPRAPWLPAGVHGAARSVDHRTFAWHDDGWAGFDLPTAVIYEMHIGTFSAAGTFDGGVAHLDHLVALGVTAVEVMPVNAFSGDRGWGYDGVGLYAVHEPYGGPAGFKRFVDECHARGLAVVLDVVYNHLGAAGNYLGRFGPYFTDKYRTPWGPAVNFDDAGSDEVRAFVVDNALMWLRDYHCDALRLDAVHAIHDASATHILEELAVAVAALAREVGRPLYLIAESDLNDPRVVERRELGGYGVDAQWSDDFHHALHAVLTGERDGYYVDFGSLGDFATALRRAFVYVGQHSAYRQRRHGRTPAGLPAWRFLGYAQNHDQIGNRAPGERVVHLVSPGLAKVAAALVLLGPFVPLLFQGEEWGASTPFQYFTSHDDAELARAVRDGRRAEFATFGWDPASVPDPQDAQTHRRCVLRWDELDAEPHRELLDWHRQLIGLRRATPDLAPGALDDTEVDYDEAARWLVMRRPAAVVVCNFSKHQQVIPLRHPGGVVLTSAADPVISAGGIRLAAESVAVLRETSGA
ncbi:MAG: malto-oligosyltrehalose trehalohydrolase [Mycobacteriales bacterium]|nr:malto-oligosyltrehalose trehalohydrolase [Frankia sp.]